MPATSGIKSNPNPLLLEYVCSHCDVLLKSTDAQIDRLDVKEDCPTCGTPLSRTLTVRSKERKKQSAATPKLPQLRRASDSYVRLRFGVPVLDKALIPLVAGDTLCISGPHATSLLEGLCCHALLPLRAGGLDSERVVYVDAGNTSQIYRFVRLARLYGLNYRDALRRVVQTRTFTIHQLASVIIKELSAAVESAKAKAVFVSDLFELFLREPNHDVKEAERLAAEMGQALSKVAAKCVLAISLTRTSSYDRFLFADTKVKRLKFADGRARYQSRANKEITLRLPADALLLEA
jgi:hypothetical protein